jgi:hypothetical protein
MPWKETDALKERVKFLLEWEKRWQAGKGQLNFAALCREFGVCRQVGYEWLSRYRDAGHDIRAAAERSRKPLHSPSQVSEELDRGGSQKGSSNMGSPEAEVSGMSPVAQWAASRRSTKTAKLDLDRA